MTNQAIFLNVLKPEPFVDQNGEEKTLSIKVGVAFPLPADRGYNLKIVEGISITGGLVVMSPKQKNDQQGSYRG